MSGTYVPIDWFDVLCVNTIFPQLKRFVIENYNTFMHGIYIYDSHSFLQNVTQEIEKKASEKERKILTPFARNPSV